MKEETFAHFINRYADRVLGPPKRHAKPSYDEVMADAARKSENVKLNPKPMGIHGGKFGEASRGAVDKLRGVVNELPGTVANYGKDRELGMEILAEFLRKKFGQ
jgi:hypothetical protein